MNWIDKLERRYGNLGIPYLINGLMIGQLAAGLIVLLFDWKFASMISLSRSGVLSHFCFSPSGWAVCWAC